MIFINVGGVSGAHLNPAVTLAFSCSKLFPWKKVLPYFLSQYLAAYLAAALVYLVYSGKFSLWISFGQLSYKSEVG